MGLKTSPGARRIRHLRALCCAVTGGGRHHRASYCALDDGGPALRQESIISGSPLIQWSRVLGEVFVRCSPKGMNHSSCSQH